MKINIRKATELDFEQIILLFKEFAEFEKHPEKMVNSVERMETEKGLFNCFVAETPDNEKERNKRQRFICENI